MSARAPRSRASTPRQATAPKSKRDEKPTCLLIASRATRDHEKRQQPTPSRRRGACGGGRRAWRERRPRAAPIGAVHRAALNSATTSSFRGSRVCRSGALSTSMWIHLPTTCRSATLREHDEQPSPRALDEGRVLGRRRVGRPRAPHAVSRRVRRLCERDARGVATLGSLSRQATRRRRAGRIP